MGKLAIVSGYATADYPARLPAPPRGAQTCTVEALTTRASTFESWPRAGGAALYACRRIAAAGHHARALAVVGDDANGRLYLNACHLANVGIEGVICTEEARTPWCMLLYHDDGTYSCLIDRGEVGGQLLTDSQRRILAKADFVCIAAGCATTSAAVLDSVADHVPVAWITKRDSISFPAALCERLAHRADLIFCNASERSIVDLARATGTRAGQAIIETRGADGVLLDRDGHVLEFPCEPVYTRDATGAGDTLAGEVVAKLLSDGPDLEAAIWCGIEAGRELLLSRVDVSQVQRC